MKSLVTIIVSLLVSLTVYAEIDKKTTKAINDANSNIGVVLSYLQEQEKDLDAKLLTANTANKKYKTRVENFKNRKIQSSQEDETNIEEYLMEFPSLGYLLRDKEEVIEKLSPLKENDYAKSYLLIIEMDNSLDKVYDEDTNAKLLKQAEKGLKLIDGHSDDFNMLLSKVKDYRFGMYELGRLFEVIDETGFQGNSMTLAQREEVPEDVLKIPFINRTLTNYIKYKKSGKNSRYMSQKEREALYNALPDAFPMLKNN